MSREAPWRDQEYPGRPELGFTHHRVAGLKHWAQQHATLLFGKWLSERIQNARVPGVLGVWALWATTKLWVAFPIPICLLPGVEDRPAVCIS